jgi:hypothetical protein
VGPEALAVFRARKPLCLRPPACMSGGAPGRATRGTIAKISHFYRTRATMRA